MNLNDIEIFSDELNQKIENLIDERNFVRRELERFSESHIERDKDFVKIFIDMIKESEAAEIDNNRLSYFIAFH